MCGAGNSAALNSTSVTGDVSICTMSALAVMSVDTRLLPGASILDNDGSPAPAFMLHGGCFH